MAESTLNGHWQTTVPADVRHALKLAPGTRLVWDVTPDGVIIVRPNISLSSERETQAGTDAEWDELAESLHRVYESDSETDVSTKGGGVSTGCGAWGVDFLFTSSVQRMLAAALMRPDYEYTLEEMLSIAATGRGNTQRQLERLLEAGVLREERRRGRQRRITANRHFFLYPELESIARKTFGLAVPLVGALQPFSECIDEALVLSRAWHPADGYQDVDLVVIGAACKMSLQTTVRGIARAHGRLIHLRTFSSLEWLEFLGRDPIAAAAANRAEKLPLRRTGPGAARDHNARGLTGQPAHADGFTPSLLGGRPR